MRAAIAFRVILAAAVLALVAAAVFVTQPVLFRHHAPPPAEADPLRLRFDVKTLSSLAPRNLAEPETLDAAARHIVDAWRTAGLVVIEQAYDVSGVRVRNLIVRFGSEGAPRIVVGAHYDAAGRNPGADDDASGVAGLLELGRLLGRYPPARPVELVAYTLEEPPWFGGPQMGSAVHAKSLRLEGVRVRGMLSLEMIGTFSDEPGSQTFPSPVLGLIYPRRGNFVAVAGRPGEYGLIRRVKRAMVDATDLPVRSFTAPAAVAGHDLSDNRSYWEEGYRAVMITDTAFYRNQRYHTPEDTADRLDYDRMAKVVTGVFAAVRALAGS